MTSMMRNTWTRSISDILQWQRASRTLEMTIISVTRMPQCKLQNYFCPGPRPLPTLGHYALPERYKDLKWITKLNYWISICRGIVCATAAAAAKLEKSTATTNSGPHTHTYECASVCVCVLLATRRAQCALCAPLSASNNDNGLESSQNTHSHTHTQTTSPLDNRATQ